jgi:hypothetical protein
MNRSEGWENAKMSGHLNERKVEEELQDENTNVINMGTKRVPSILGRKTPTKPDLIIDYLINGNQSKRSIKKSLTGQVQMNKVKNFVKGFEMRTGYVIPTDIVECLHLLFGGSSNVNQILSNRNFEHSNPKIRSMELRRKTVTFETLHKYNHVLIEKLIQWLKDNIKEITSIVFKTGWVSEEKYFANELWYKNLVDSGTYLDKIFNIEEIISKSELHKDSIYPKTKNGGTVINLPWGWIQYHQGCVQFQHSYHQITEMLT